MLTEQLEFPLQPRTWIHLPATLHFVESNDGYSTYEERTATGGCTVYLQHGTAKRMFTFDDLVENLSELWAEFQAAGGISYDFREHLRTCTIEPDDVDEILSCSDCGFWMHTDDSYGTNNGDVVCDGCSDSYYTCYHCEDRYTDTTTVGDEEVCEGCLERRYDYCDECEEYYNRDDGHDHEDEDESAACCESPAQGFYVRNDGDEPLANDTRTTVTLPAGVITEVGLAAIRDCLHSYRYTVEDVEERRDVRNMTYRLEELGDKWQAKDGNYTKRLSRFAHKCFGLKIPPALISEVGNIASAHSAAINFEVEVTRNLNLPAAEFVHGGSCWWTSYSYSRCVLKSNGGFALRTFNPYGATGRAWVIPLKLTDNGLNPQLIPTFETMEPAAFVLFNGYGALENYAPARILSHMAGMTYRKITFTGSPMYVNNDSGYLIAPEEIAARYTDGALYLNVTQHSDLYTREMRTREKEMVSA